MNTQKSLSILYTNYEISEKEIKGIQIVKESKALTVWRWHDAVHRKP